jgi:hypothetical protein
MNNGQKSLSINETFILEPVDGVEVYSACTAFYTNNILSCTGNTEIILGVGGVSTNLSFSANTFYGDGSNLTGISTQDTYITGGTYSAGTAIFRNNTGGTFSVSGFSTGANFTGGTVSGATRFTNGLTANTISATTYENLPIKYYAEFSGSPSVRPIVYSANSIAIGSGAEALNENMFVVGQYAGSGATNAYNSNFLGSSAGYQATDAFYSNFIGQYAGGGATGANYSNFIGNYAGSGAFNVQVSNFIGDNAGGNATNASYSTIIGYRAGFATDASLSIGSNNIIIGTDITLPPNAANSINIGGVLFGSNTYQTDFLGIPFTGASSTGRIGVNVAQPTHSLHVSGDTRIQGGLTATSYNGYNPLPTQAAISSGVTLSFITDTVYGTLLTPETSSAITANVTGALLGVTNILIHSGSTTPTFGSQYKKLSGSGNYSAGTINYIFCTYIASTEIIYSINQR